MTPVSFVAKFARLRSALVDFLAERAEQTTHLTMKMFWRHSKR
jgi:hypothetical protein